MWSITAIDLYLSLWTPGVSPNDWPDWSNLTTLEYLDMSHANTSPFTGES